MQTVEFLKPWRIYSRGDIAGFETEQAEKLVEGGVAQPYAAEPEPEPEAKPSKAGAK